MNPKQSNNPQPPKPAAGAANASGSVQSTNSFSDFYPTPAQTSPGGAVSSPLPDNPDGNETKRHRNLKSLISTFIILAVAPIIALSVTTFAIQSYQVDGQSMESTLQDRDRLIVDKLPRTWARITGHNYTPHRADIVIFNQADLPGSAPGESKQLIKRVIGLPSDRVVIKDGAITVYNNEHPNGFNPDKTLGYHIDSPTTSGDIDLVLAKNQIFVCGDNRPNSEDSRYFGPVDTQQVVGKLVLRLLPINKLQRY